MNRLVPSVRRKYQKAIRAYKELSFSDFCFVMTDMAKKYFQRMIYAIVHPKHLFYKDKPVFLESIKVTKTPSVTIIIPFRDKASVLKECLNSILDNTLYKNYTILLVDNQSREAETLEYLSSLSSNTQIKILKYDNVFNYSALHNWAIKFVEDEYVLFLNNDTKVISPEWLGALMSWIQRDDVGVVGALLLYPNGSVQHAGVGITPVSIFHLHEGEQPDETHKGEINGIRELRAVTGACLMTKKSIFTSVGGMDSEHFAVGLNDIDYCMKVGEQGLKVIYNPEARLYHFESYSRGHDWADLEKYHRLKREADYFWMKWRPYLKSVND